MVGHETIGVADPVVAFADVLEGVQEVLAIGLRLENGLLLVPAGGDMIDSASVFNAEGSRHRERIAKNKRNVKSQDLTLSVPHRQQKR